ncbi:MAG: hypothetical protein J5887_02190 [Erysipelotrichaceae bacterium]|nr:hypothetical protein [Erysipelotrichaceae bacterium]
MKKTDLYLISEGLLFLALGSHVNEDWLIAAAAFTLSAGLMILLALTGRRRKSDIRDMLIVFLVQLLITLSTFSMHTCLPCLMVAVSSVLQFSALKTLSRGSRKMLSVLSLSAAALLFVIVLLAHIFISAAFNVREVMAASYLPMAAMLSVPYIGMLAEGFSLHDRRLMVFH